MDEFEPLADVSREYYIDLFLNDPYIRSGVIIHNIEILQPFILNYIELIPSNNILDSNIYNNVLVSDWLQVM